MIIHLEKKKFDLSKPIALSIKIDELDKNPKAFYAPDTIFEPVQTEHFIGSTELGGLLNFKNIHINPHGSGTHTECVGHIAKEPYHIYDCLQKFHFLAQVISISPSKMTKGDNVITTKELDKIEIEEGVEAVIIRTLPNSTSKLTKDWSGTNPTYIDFEAMQWLVKQNIEHFLIDVPSVDREEDEGKLLAHKTFWNYPSEQVRTNCTITEMIFVPDEVVDGVYLLNIQIAPLMIDASPSNITIYQQI
jgi:kynurenine formamidase